MRSSPFFFCAPLPAAALPNCRLGLEYRWRPWDPAQPYPVFVLTAELSSGTVAQAFRPEGPAFSSHPLCSWFRLFDRGICFFLRDLCVTVPALGVYPDRVGVLSLCLFFQFLTLLWT